MKISIILPAYNAEKTIEHCVNSILLQSYQNFEILLINDGSLDNTSILCKALAKTDKRIRFIDCNANAGVVTARNIGLNNVTGDWITFCDSDDYVDNNWLIDFVSKIKEDAELIIQGLYFDNGIKNNIYKLFLLSKEDNRDDVVLKLQNIEFLGYLPCKLFRASIIKKYNINFEEMPLMEDELFVLKYLKYTNKIVTTDRCNYHYDNTDFYTKYKQYNFYGAIKLFLAACDIYGRSKNEIKDKYLSLLSDWLIYSYESNKSNKEKIMKMFCTTVQKDFRQMKYCRKSLLLLKLFIFTNHVYLSDKTIRLYVLLLKIIGKK